MSFYETVGFYTVATVIILSISKLSKFLWSTYLGSSLGFGYKFKRSDGAFAVITGSTDGIG